MARPIVLLHGFTHTGASWRPVIAELGAARRTLAPDIRGHGDSGPQRPITFDACVQDVFGLVATGPFSLVGYSMGGRIALQAALAGQDRIGSLVLIGSAPGIGDPVEREARQVTDEQLAGEIESAPIEQFARRWARQPLLRGQAPSVAAAAHEDRLRNDPAGLAAALRGIGAGTMEPLWSRLGELRMPVTLIAGERDAKYCAVARRMAERIPHARVLIVPAAGHSVHLEAPGVVAAILAEV